MASAAIGLGLAWQPKAAPGHRPLHIGCKHKHGSTWLTGRGEMLGYKRNAADEAEPRSLLPFTAWSR